MTSSESDILGFAAVDGIAFAAERGRLKPERIPALKIENLGSLIELWQLSESMSVPAPDSGLFGISDDLGRLIHALRRDQDQWICPVSQRAGFLKTGIEPPEDTVWTRFGMSAQRAAMSSGFPKRIAAQMTAALGELRSNIYEHSESLGTGLVAFHAANSRFEFVAADQGIGILTSLRQSSVYADLEDHGEALRLALTDGVSRFGSNSDRGHGFRPLFIGLANLNGTLRFRSGDHAFLIDGSNPSLMSGRPAEKPVLKGFFASVNCETASSAGL